MGNVRKGKIDSRNVSILVEREKPNALLMSRATMDKADEAVLEEQAEVLYTEPKLVEREHLEKMVKEPKYANVSDIEQIPPFGGKGAAYLNEMVGYKAPVQQVIEQAEVISPEVLGVSEPKIVPVSSGVPNVSIDEKETVQTEKFTAPQFVKPADSRVVDPLEATINTVVVNQEKRREVTEEPVLKSAQEFLDETEERTQDPLVEASIVIEDIRKEVPTAAGRKFVETINAAAAEYAEKRARIDEEYKEALARATEEYKRAEKETAQRVEEGLNKASRLIGSAKNNSRIDGFKEVQRAVNDQADMLNEYGGMSNAR